MLFHLVLLWYNQFYWLFLWSMFFNIFVMLLFIYILSNSVMSLEYFGILYMKYSLKLASMMGLSRIRPITAFFVPILFCFMFSSLLMGFMPYSYMYMLDCYMILFVSIICWLVSFLYLICTESLKDLFVKKGFSLPMQMFLFIIEVLGVFMKPLSLFIRLYLNIAFGHYLLWYLSLFLIKLGAWSYFFSTPFFLFELLVFVIQSFVFSFLVGMYFEE